MKRLLLLLPFVLSAVGCSSMNIQRPTASVSGMKVGDVNATGFTMNFDVDLKNPNTVALPLTAADYTLGLGGVNVANGKAKPDGTIPAGGSKSVQIPVTLTYENLLAVEKAIVSGGGNIPYAFDGGLKVNSGVPLLGDVRVPLQYNGTLALKDVVNNPKALLQSPAARRLAQELVTSFFNR